MKQPDRITNAFTALREQMLSLAERITGNRDDAADAVQDAFVKLWQHPERYQTTSHVQGAGMTAVRNLSIDMARRKGHQANVPIEDMTEAVEDPADSEPTTAYWQVRHIIENDLSSRQRTIIDLREMEGLEFEDIAARLNMTAANVRVELSRARKKVREIYRNRKEEIT